LSAFNQRRAGANVRNVPLVSAAPTKSGVVTPAAPKETRVEKTDHLKLSSASANDQREDIKISVSKEIEELQLRIQILQQNVKLLKDFVSDTKSENSSVVPLLLSIQEQSPSLAKPVDSTAPVSPDSTLVSAARTSPEQPSPSTSIATKDSNANNALPENLKNLWHDFSGFLTQNIFATLTALIALSAMVVAWILRRAGARRDDEPEDSDLVSHANPEVQSDFDKRLQSISLELNDDFTPVNKSGLSTNKPG